MSRKNRLREVLGVRSALFRPQDFARPLFARSFLGADLGEGAGGALHTSPPPRDEAFFVFAFKICLPHQSVMPFPSGAPRPKKNPGSAPKRDYS